MNERIKQLAEQALFESDFDDEQNIKITMDIFAQMIVRECMNVAQQQRDPANLNYKPSERFVEDLRQHFGVEE